MPEAFYREWHQTGITVRGEKFIIATKPGVYADGRLDPASVMLAEYAAVSQGDIVVSMNCGNALVAAVAARAGASQVVLSDRNVLAAEAARRTMTANGASGAVVINAHGSNGMPAGLTADVVTIRIPHEKMALVQLLVDAYRLLRTGGNCYIAGGTHEGIKTAAKLLDGIFGNIAVLAYDSGHRIVVATKSAHAMSLSSDLANPYLEHDLFRAIETTLRGIPTTLYTRPGVFSWDHLDEATSVLADAIDIPIGSSVLDLGCGAGALGIAASRLTHSAPVVMVDADIEAVRSATRSADHAGIANWRVLPSDVAGAVLNETFDVVVSNPPFHVGKDTELVVPLQFIEDSWHVLAPGGRLFIVANRTLPYEVPIRNRFGAVTTVHDGRRFKVLSAIR